MNTKKSLSILITVMLTLSMALAVTPQVRAAYSISILEKYDPVTGTWSTLTSPYEGFVGDTIRVTIIDATPGGLVKLYWDSVKEWDGKAGFVGESYAVGTTAKITFTVPAAVNGPHTIIAKDMETGSITHVTFKINAKITVSPPRVLAGDTVSVSGAGFAGLKDAVVICNNTAIEDTVANETISGLWTGTTGNGVLAKKPIVPYSVTLNVTNTTDFSTSLGLMDNGKGTLQLNFASGNNTGVSASGTIDYVTGAVSLTWNWTLLGTVWANVTYTIYNTAKANATTSVATNDLGSFTASIVIPLGTSPATLKVFSIDGNGNIATGTVDVVKTIITLTPTVGLRGSTVTVTGRGFSTAPGATVDVRWYMTPSQTPHTGVTGTYVTVIDDYPIGAGGTFTTTFTVPTVGDPTPPGTYYAVYAIDTAPTPNTALANFMVISAAKIVLSPTSGYKDTTVSVSGSWFSANSLVTLKFGNLTLTTTPSTIYTLADGSFFATFKVPAVAAGEYTVTATDAKGVSATAKFTVTVPIVEIRTRSTTYTQGDQVSIYAKSTEPLVNIKLVITDPDKIIFWQYTIAAGDVITDPVTGFRYLNWSVVPPKLPDDATVGNWNFTAYDPTNKIVATNLFKVVAKTTVADVSEQIDQLSDAISRLQSAINQLQNSITAITNQLSGIKSAADAAKSAADAAKSAADSATSAANAAKSAADAAKTAAENAAKALSDVKSAADAAKTAAESASSAASNAVSAANSAKSAADAAKASADAAKSTADAAKTAADAAKGAAEGLATPVWIAVVLSLVAAIASIFAIVTLRRKIAG